MSVETDPLKKIAPDVALDLAEAMASGGRENLCKITARFIGVVARQFYRKELSPEEVRNFFRIVQLGARLRDQRDYGVQFEQRLVTDLIRDFSLGISSPTETRSLAQLYQNLGVNNLQGFYDYVHRKTPLHGWIPRHGDETKGYILQSRIKGYSEDFASMGSLMELISLSLIQQLPTEELENIDAIVGFAESGIAIASNVSAVSGIPMIATRTTPEDVPAKNRLELREPGASFEGLYTSIAPGVRAWLIDDELTRGWTLVSFLRAFEEHGVEVVSTSVVFEVMGEGMDGKNYFEQKTGRNLNTLIRLSLPE